MRDWEEWQNGIPFRSISAHCIDITHIFLGNESFEFVCDNTFSRNPISKNCFCQASIMNFHSACTILAPIQFETEWTCPSQKKPSYGIMSSWNRSKLQFPNMNIVPLVQSTMKMGSLWESKTCIKNPARTLSRRYLCFKGDFSKEVLWISLGQMAEL